MNEDAGIDMVMEDRLSGGGGWWVDDEVDPMDDEDDWDYEDDSWSDGDSLASIGHGTDEDYGYFGGEDF